MDPKFSIPPEELLISSAELEKEIHGIYDSLKLVEAEYVSIDPCQISTPDSQLTTAQWQALIALHRTLLYEQHDYLMATRRLVVSGEFADFAQRFAEPVRQYEEVFTQRNEYTHSGVPADIRRLCFDRARVVSGTEMPPEFRLKILTEPLACGVAKPVAERKMPPESQTGIRTEPVVRGKLGGNEVLALPDTGAAMNFISARLVTRHRWTIDRSKAGLITNAIGKAIRTLGTVNATFEFHGEAESHLEEFHVLSVCPKDVILGSQFLKHTETMTRFVHRITRRLRGLTSHRLWYTGHIEQRVAGWLNGKKIHALPDTGSDLMVVSSRFAESRGLKVDEGSESRRKVNFADGSFAYTTGIVRGVEWRFDSDSDETYEGGADCRRTVDFADELYAYTTGQFDSSSSETYKCDFFVLPDLRCDVVLSYDFLRKTSAFSRFGRSFVDATDNDFEGSNCSVMMEGESLFDRLHRKIRKLREKEHADPEPKLDNNQEQEAILRKARDEYLRAKIEASNLPKEEQDRMLESFREKYRNLRKAQSGNNDQQIASAGSAAPVSGQQ